MIELMKCPVCNTENNRDYYTGPFGIEEDHYYCKNCGYSIEMSYGPTFTYMDTIAGSEEDRTRKSHLLEVYADRIKQLGLEIDPDYSQYL